jgi:hypothetical protein
VERAKTNYLAAAELGSVGAMLYLGRLLDKDDSQRFVWLGRAASANVGCVSFLKETLNQVRNFNLGTGHASVVFVIG